LITQLTPVWSTGSASSKPTSIGVAFQDFGVADHLGSVHFALSLDEIQQRHRESSASTRYPDDVLERFDFLAASTSGSDRKL
jgi:hypothetical protein